MPQEISIIQIQQLRNSIQNGGAADAANAYHYLYLNGYDYAGWAEGVARADSLSGNAALKFMQETALMGLGGDKCRDLTSAQIDKIRADMALRTLSEYERIASENQGVLDRDLLYKEVRDVHVDVFKTNDLSIENWTLDTPMEIIRQRSGEGVQEQFWKSLRDTGGDGLDAIEVNIRLMELMDFYRKTLPDQRQKIDEWSRHFDDMAELRDVTWDTAKYYLWDDVRKFIGLLEEISKAFDQAKNWFRRYDPICLDLDSDGIELIDATRGILFDHANVGIAKGTAWVQSDDGILVIDKNGNGLVDGGSELFGDGNPDSARDGSEPVELSAGLIALRKYDSNHDSKFDINDAAFGDVKVWRDLNQDGVSQSDELFSLGDVGIQSINLAPTSTENVDVGNGNVADSTGQFTRVDGRTGNFYDLLLASNPFYREFKDAIALTDKAKGIAEMQGSGMVRDLREAASIDDSLADAIAGLIPGISRDEMMSRMDDILLKWAKTSTMKDTQTGVVDAGTINGSFHVSKAGDPNADLTQIVSILERFNGTQFFAQTSDGKLRVGNVDYAATAVTVNGVVTRSFDINLEPGAAVLLMQSYEALKRSVYAGLVLQTRLKSYVNELDLTFDKDGFGVDTTRLNADIHSRFSNAPAQTFQDVLDLVKYGKNLLGKEARSLLGTLNDLLTQQVSTSASLDVLRDAGFITDQTLLGSTSDNVFVGAPESDSLVLGSGADIAFGLAGDDSIDGGAGNDILFGGQGNDVLDGGTDDDQLFGGEADDQLLGGLGDDVLDGGAGNDVLNGSTGNNKLYGGDGNDVMSVDVYAGNNVFVGGAGNDQMTGGWRSDRYEFNLGDGQDTIIERYAGYDNTDVLAFGTGIAAADVRVLREGNDLVFHLANGTDSVRVKDQFNDSSWATGAQLEQVTFADGTLWTTADIQAAGITTIGTDGDDTFSGYTAKDILQGGAGNDTLLGYGGSDVLDGGAGNDVMSVDVYAGNNVFVGGAGNDQMTGGWRSDRYEFNLGDGQDTIIERHGGYDNTDVLAFGAGIDSDELWLTRTGNDLVFSIIGTTENVTVQNWFAGAQYQVEETRLSNGQILTASEANTLVSAMASYDPPTGNALPDSYRAELGLKIAANW